MPASITVKVPERADESVELTDMQPDRRAQAELTHRKNRIRLAGQKKCGPPTRCRCAAQGRVHDAGLPDVRRAYDDPKCHSPPVTDYMRRVSRRSDVTEK
jgi:hypothetical protein